VSFPVIGLLGSGGAVFALAVLAAVSAYCFGASRRAYALAALALLVPLLFPSLTQVRMSPYRGLEHALRYPGARHLETYETGFSRVDIFKSPAVRFAPGLNVNYLNDLPLQVGLAVDGAGITAITNTSGESLSFLGELPSALPYELRERNRVCVIDPKGGLPVLLARHAGAREVIAMESDPLVLRAVRQYPDRFTGGIYGKDTRSGLARSRLLMMPGGFDLIDLSLMGSAPFGVYGASEDYRLTREAFGVYLDSLAPE
ncbi:MAG: hypothetical protein GWO24_22885, partial [Akkermansiaceae bacterium]|nr:hypothetical protein [Akkermansiaceae bacterium]